MKIFLKRYDKEEEDLGYGFRIDERNAENGQRE